MRTGPKVKSPEVRFWERIDKTDACWYAGGRRYGNKYVMLFLGPGKGQTSMHRFSYELHHGPVPLGLFVCHRCDTKNCVNPAHLYAGTHEENNLDNIERGNYAPKGAKRPRTEGRYAFGRKLDAAAIATLGAEYASGEFTQMDLAARYRVSQATVSATIRGVTNMGRGESPKRRTGHFRRKLTLEQCSEIRRLYATGEFTQRALAERFGCDQTYVSVLVHHSET